MVILIFMKKYIRLLLRFLVLIIAALIYSVGIGVFLDPNDIAPGGITGISILLNRLINIETGTILFILNIPILILGIYKFGVRFIATTAFMILMVSSFTNVLALYPLTLTSDRLLASLLGGAMVAIGVGVAFRLNTTTGGIDIIIKVLRKRYRHIKTGSLYFIFDFFIVLLSWLVFGNLEAAAYAMISVVVSSYIMDKILYGSDEARLLFIISEKSKDITTRILNELSAGATYIEGRGAYYGKEKKIAMCVLKKQIAPRAVQIVMSVDEKAFVIITSASEIYGEGYKKFDLK